MLLQAQHLMKKYGSHMAVNDVSLSFVAGQFVALLGHNGAGKSTTIQMLTGLLVPSAGQIKYQPGTTVGMVFQDSVLDNDLTVAQNLRLSARLYRHRNSFWQARLIAKFALDKIQNQKYGTLSGGQRRRVDIVRALLGHPAILFLDEPTTGLDLQTRNLIWQVLNELRHTERLTLILTTHYLEEANQADWVYVMHKGQIVASNTVQHLKAEYAQNTLTVTMAIDTSLPKSIQRMGTQSSQSQWIFHPQDDQVAQQWLQRIQPATFTYQHGTMNDMFVNLTGKEL